MTSFTFWVEFKKDGDPYTRHTSRVSAPGPKSAWAHVKAGNEGASLIDVTAVKAYVDEDGSNLDPRLCDCGKEEACPLWDLWPSGIRRELI